MGYFNRAQIAEIAAKLATKAVRDTDFEPATPLTGNELVAIVQDGINKTATIADLVDQIEKNFVIIDSDKFVLYQETGDSEIGGMSQKAITDTVMLSADRIDALELSGSTITFTATPSVIAEGATTNVTLAVAISGLGQDGADLIEILDSFSQIIASGSGNSLTKTVSLSAAASFTCRVTHGSATRMLSRSVTVAGHIYYGSGTSKSDFVSNRVEYPIPTTTVARTYVITVRNEGDYVFFQIPSSMTINSVTMGGFGFPMTLQETADGMKLYRSDNTYLAGNLTLVVS